MIANVCNCEMMAAIMTMTHPIGSAFFTTADLKIKIPVAWFSLILRHPMIAK